MSDRRRYSKVAVDLPSHPKLIALEKPNEAMTLYVCGLLYCSTYLTDGIIPKKAKHRLMPEDFEHVSTDDLCAMLVAGGFWRDCGDHYEVHDYLRHQVPRASIEAMSEGGKKSRANAAGEAPSKAPCKAPSQGSGKVGSKHRDVELDIEKGQVRDAHTSAFRECEERLVSEYGAVRPKTRSALLLYCQKTLDGGADPMTGIEYGIKKAAEKGQPNAAYAFGIAEGASKQELEGSASAPNGSGWDADEFFRGKQVGR